MKQTEYNRMAGLGILSLAFTLSAGVLRGAEGGTAGADAPVLSGAPVAHRMNLEECLATALRENRRRPASAFAVAMAEAQHRQALSAYWPQVGLRGGYQRLDQSPDFLFPASTIQVPAQNLPLPPGLGLAIVDPLNNVVGKLSSFPAQSIPVPAQDVKLMDVDSFTTTLQATWLLYDGGMRKGLRQQTKGQVDMMKQEARRTELEIADSVRRYYHGSVLAGQLRQLGQDTLARMEATLNLTETMYKEGGGKVKKTDWLDNKIMVESLRSMVALLEKNEAMAQAALANTIGLPWDNTVQPTDTALPYAPFGGDLTALVGSAYRLNPDWNKVEAGLRAAEGAVRTANSEYLPKLATTGELHKWWNDYDAGIATERNREGWTVGVGVEFPLFSGFLTKNKVAETRARVAKIKEEQILLKEGLGLQVKDLVLGLQAAQKSHHATLEAMQASTENRDLNTRAYQNELVETEKVIRAQLMEALMSAQHYKTLYDHLALQSQLNLIVGTEFLKKLEGR